MKPIQKIWLVVIFAFLALTYWEMWNDHPVLAQSGVGLNFGPIVPSVANCYVDQNGKPGLPGASVLCTVGSGSSYAIYLSNNQSDYQPLVPAQAPSIAVGTQITYTTTETCQKGKGSIPAGYTNNCSGTLTITAIH